MTTLDRAENAGTHGCQVILSVEKVSKDFKGIRALNCVDFVVEKGRIHGLIGPNGSGKTTFFNVVTGALTPSQGRIFFEDKEISKSRAVCHSKVGHQPHLSAGFCCPHAHLSRERMCGGHSHTGPDLMGTFLRIPFTASRQESRMKRHARECLEFVGLEGYENRWASDLVWVKRQLLQMARALAAEPETFAA